MLETLAHLHNLHVNIRSLTTRLSRSHLSIVCRAVSSSIADVHLGDFLNKILQVESSILQKDAAYVGAYEIVPLSTLVSEFAPWTRRLEWLWSIVQSLDPESTTKSQKISPCAASILDLLEKETHTGYSDIEDMAIALLTVGQKAWMRTASLWVLYGKLPATGATDFCIKPNLEAVSIMDAFILIPGLVPRLLTPTASKALLSAGSALSQLRSQAASNSAVVLGFNDPSMSLLQHHSTVLGSLQYPINPSLLENALSLINDSISEDALSQILPRPMVLQLLQVIWRYMLLGHGEFSVSLIGHADDRVTGRHRGQTAARPVRKIGNVEDLSVKDAELSGILSKTLAELATFQTEDDVGDEALALARKILILRAADDQDRRRPIATLLPTPVHLQINLPTHSPLQLFLSAKDAKMYANTNAYLLSIHRADLHLSGLWKLSSHRRSPPISQGAGGARLAASRLRDGQRNARTRGHWSCASKLLFLVNELEAYLQGEVIHSSSLQFREWLEGKEKDLKSSRPGTSSSTGHSGIRFSSHGAEEKLPTDPRAIAEAHRRYLQAMNAALFLTHDNFIDILTELLNRADHLVALFSRLQTVWQGLDLQDDEGVVDAFSNYAQDEREVLAEMDRTRDAVEAFLVKIVEEIRNIEKERSMSSNVDAGIDEGMSHMKLRSSSRRFIPWEARTVDRLVMKLDGLVKQPDEDRDELAEGSDDE